MASQIKYSRHKWEQIRKDRTGHTTKEIGKWSDDGKTLIITKEKQTFQSVSHEVNQ